MQKLPEHGACFVCGTANPMSVGLVWRIQQDGLVFAEFTFDTPQQGPPGHAHGGASAAILDEAMGAAVWKAGLQVVAARLEVDYKRPLPLGLPTIIRARVSEKHARKVFATAEIYLPDGGIAVSGRGVYVPAPRLFEKSAFMAIKEQE